MTVPTDFRFACLDCGMFVASASVLVYTSPYAAFVGKCRRHGMTPVRMTPVRWAEAESC
jgi:hypothetical protein